MTRRAGWWNRASDALLKRVYGITNPRAARIHANRSEGSRRAWETRKARAKAKLPDNFEMDPRD